MTKHGVTALVTVILKERVVYVHSEPEHHSPPSPQLIDRPFREALCPSEHATETQPTPWHRQSRPRLDVTLWVPRRARTGSRGLTMLRWVFVWMANWPQCKKTWNKLKSKGKNKEGQKRCVQTAKLCCFLTRAHSCGSNLWRKCWWWGGPGPGCHTIGRVALIRNRATKLSKLPC